MLTDNEIIIAVAELKGVTVVYGANAWTIDGLGCYPSEHAAWQAVAEEEKSLLTSRDAIVPVIEKQPYHIKKDVFTQLACNLEAHPDPDLSAMLATPRQLCIGLLKAAVKGGWRRLQTCPVCVKMRNKKK